MVKYLILQKEREESHLKLHWEKEELYQVSLVLIKDIIISTNLRNSLHNPVTYSETSL